MFFIIIWSYFHVSHNFFYRYRNFKTFVSPRPVQFSCVSIDSTGEFIAAGGQDVFEAYLWSMKIGRLLEVSFKNHEFMDNRQPTGYAYYAQVHWPVRLVRVFLEY